jgi:hypothetical protein
MTIYTWLLRLYPAAFHRQFASDMSADFDEGYAVASERGPRAVASFVARSYGDLAASVVAQWLRSEAVIIGGMSVSAAMAMWAAAFYVAAHQWPNAPVTRWFLWQLGIALTAGSVLTQSILRINR